MNIKAGIQNNVRILIVDDSPEAIKVLGNALPQDYKRQVALSGEKALKLMAESDELPHLILLDVMMSGMGGYEVCRIIKEDERLRDIPVIFLSAKTDTKDKVEAFSNGGVDYITKPFEIEEVRARINTHLKLYYLQQELEKHNNHLEELVQAKVREISESQMAMIFALVKLTDCRDEITGSHVERTREFCRLLAVKLSQSEKYRYIIDDDFVEQIFNASPLHDIGKISVPDRILLKPGRLTPGEFEIIKTHTLVGSKILNDVQESYPGNSFVRVGAEIARSHHEKWDGSGYPDGLSGDEIPISARIMALADVYDALRTRRPYKEPIPHQECMDVIAKESGKQFEPLVVQAFLEIEKAFEAVYYSSVDMINCE